MAQLLQPFNAQQFDPTQSAGMLPIGKHKVIIESSEVKPNKDNTGGYLQLNLKTIDGPNAGISGAYRLNLYHSNPQTVEIAHRQLSAVCHVTGVYMLQDSAQLHNIPFMVEVGPQKTDAQYNEVKKVFDANGNEPGKTGAAPAAQPQQPQQPAAGAGWHGQGAQQPQQPQGQPGAAWGGQPQQPQQQPQGGPAWGGQPQQQQPAQPGNAPAWGGQAAPQQPQQPQGQQQQPAAGWQQQQPQGGAAPWGQR